MAELMFFVGLVLVALVMPLVTALRATRALREGHALGERVAEMSRRLAAIEDEIARNRRATQPPADGPAPSAADSPLVQSPADPAARESPTELPPVAELPEPEDARPPVSPAPLPHDGRAAAARPSLETRIGANWLLYAGIGTLVLGVSYFVKYAFDNNWVTAAMRVLLGAGGGLALVGVGRHFAARGLTLFGQMLSGGGIAMLYVAVYAALQFYALVGPATAFALMAAVTALSAWRAHREDSQGLAVLAVAGGFATPMLVGGDARTPHVLFGYNALLVLGTLWLSRHHQWPALHLVSFGFAGVTIASWADRHYVSTRWLTTELWITAFAALFFLIRRTIPSSPAVGPQLARAALGLTPLLYHAASLAILWPHAVGLLIYLIAATAAGITSAGHTQQRWVRLATWLLVALPALSWLVTRPARWDPAPFVTLFGIYVLHLLAGLREMGEDARTDLDQERLSPSTRAPIVEIALLHLNGLWLWAGLAVLFERIFLARLETMTFALSGWQALLAAYAWGRHREMALHFVALASALAAAGVAVLYDGAAVTVAWAIEGAGLVLLGLHTSRRWLQIGGGALVATAVISLLEHLASPASVTALPILNVRSLASLVVVGVLVVLAWRFRESASPENPPARAATLAVLVLGAAVLILLWASAEVTAFFARGAWAEGASRGAGAVTSAVLARDVALTLLWAGYAILLIAIGIHRRFTPLRVLAIAILAFTLGKVFVIDLARLDRFYRILSTCGLGLLLLGASYLYQRFTAGRD